MVNQKVRRLLISIVMIALLAVCTRPVFAQGQIRLDPHSSYYPLPIMLSSPATFNVSTESPEHTAYNPVILLVMTNASYQGLTGNVLVEWDGGSKSFAKEDFTSVVDNSEKIPPGTTPGAGYTVASLKEHIGVNGTQDDALYYAYGPFLSNPINATSQTFNVTLPSTNPRMLVYVLGSSSENPGVLDMFVPPTQPGFVVPDLATILLASASFSAFALYALKRRKT